MIRNEVDMIRKLVVARVEDALTAEDLHADAELWSKPEMKGYAAFFNFGSADVSDWALDDLKAYADSLAQSAFSSAQAIVINTAEQQQLMEALLPLLDQAGVPTELWGIFDNEQDAIDWVVENHSHEC